mgnify:CR=1 FL=1
MKIDIYKPVVLFLLPAVLAGCSGEREPFPQGGKAGLRIESCSSRGGTDGSPTLVKDFGMVLLDDTGGGYAGAVNPLHVTYGEGWIFPEVTLTETPLQAVRILPFRRHPGKGAAPEPGPPDRLPGIRRDTPGLAEPVSGHRDGTPALPAGIHHRGQQRVHSECGGGSYRRHL